MKGKTRTCFTSIKRYLWLKQTNKQQIHTKNSESTSIYLCHWEDLIRPMPLLRILHFWDSLRHSMDFDIPPSFLSSNVQLKNSPPPARRTNNSLFDYLFTGVSPIKPQLKKDSMTSLPNLLLMECILQRPSPTGFLFD